LRHEKALIRIRTYPILLNIAGHKLEVLQIFHHIIPHAQYLMLAPSHMTRIHVSLDAIGSCRRPLMPQMIVDDACRCQSDALDA